MLSSKNQPTFVLKNINVDDIYKKYTKGFFNRGVPEKSKIKITKPITRPVLQNQQKNVQVKTITTGAEHQRLFVTNRYTGGVCYHCRLPFTCESVGYPLSYHSELVFMDNQYTTNHIFWVEGQFCSYECCYAYLKVLDTTKDFSIRDSEILLKLMYKLEFGVHDLQPAKDFKLLIQHGGSLTEEEWRNKAVSYTRTNNVIKIPLQIIYNKV